MSESTAERLAELRRMSRIVCSTHQAQRLRRGLAEALEHIDAQAAEIERLRRERETLAEAVRAMKYFFDSDYSDPEESATLNWSYAHQKWLEALAQLKAPNAPDRQIQARGEVGPPSLTVESSEGDTRPLRASEGPERAFCEEGRG